MSEHVVAVTESTFHEVLGAATVPVVVDFWAEWCTPCKMIAPILDEIASDHDGKILIAKLNVDENPNLARDYDVMSIPTLIVFRGFEIQKRLVGAKAKPQLVEELAEFL